MMSRLQLYGIELGPGSELEEVFVRARVRVRIRVWGGGILPTTSQTMFYIVGLARKPYTVIVNLKTRRILIRIIVTVHGQAALPVFG